MPVPHVPPPGPWVPPFGTFKNGGGSIVGGKAVMDQLSSTAPSNPHVLVEGSFFLDRWERIGDTNEGVRDSIRTIDLTNSTSLVT